MVEDGASGPAESVRSDCADAKRKHFRRPLAGSACPGPDTGFAEGGLKFPCPPELALSSGFWTLCIDPVLQAEEGADLDFLVGKRGPFVPKDNH